MSAFVFDGYRLDLAQRELSWDRAPLHLEPKAFNVLTTLISESHRAVSRRELLDLHWPGESVSRGTLPQCIWTIRRALRDTASEPRYIKTVRGFGYRFIGLTRADREAG